MSSLSDLVSEHGIASEMYEVVRTYEIYLNGNDTPRPLRVKILRGDDDRFTPSLSHAVQKPGWATPYSPSWHPGETIEEAEDQVYSYIVTSYKPEDRGAKWEPNELF